MFEFKKTSSESKDVLHSEHLKPGVSPIMACVGTPEQFRDNPGNEEKIHRFGQNVEQNGRYIMSSIDASDKFSKDFIWCTGLVVAGKDRQTGENVSFFTHQNPYNFLRGKKDDFINDLRERLHELRERCEDGTIDAAIVGGDSGNEWFDARKRMYIKSVRLLSREVKNELGFEPVVMTGPKIVPKNRAGGGEDDVFYDNAHRRIYIMRPIKKGLAGSFIPSEIRKQKRNWK